MDAWERIHASRAVETPQWTMIGGEEHAHRDDGYYGCKTRTQGWPASEKESKWRKERVGGGVAMLLKLGQKSWLVAGV
ncbi:MoxY [Sesbania bispinosa]|nr:MoxY [Sesbania bispinosa]